MKKTMITKEEVIAEYPAGKTLGVSFTLFSLILYFPGAGFIPHSLLKELTGFIKAALIA